MTTKEQKSSADIIVEKLQESQSQISELSEKTTEELKSVGDKIVLGIKEGFESKSKEEIKSLEDKLANKEAEIKSLRSSHGVSKIKNDLEVKSLTNLASALASQKQVSIDSEEYKSIRFSDATTTGNFNDASPKMGEININLQSTVGILNDIDVMPAQNSNDGSLAWDGYDESLVDMFDANEMDAAQLSEAVKKSLIKLNMREVKAKMVISSKVIQNVLSNGSQVDNLNRNLRSLERRYDRKLATQVFKDIIANANYSLVSKVASTTAEAPANAQTREDLRLFPTSLKVQYVSTSVMYVSRAFLNALYAKEASDGHLATEQFVFGTNGVASYVTAERAIPVRVFEHAQIGTYKSLADGTTDITVDYINGSATNTGKLLAFIGDLKHSYKLIPSSIGTIGYDSGIANILNGYCPAGKISFAAQGIIANEAIKVFYAS